jgi:catechol 2,3-dioxygenase-like lactoylglutathione lyase family enzyme
MSIKVADLAYVRIRLPDLDKAERFLLDFGLIPALREARCRYFRATDAMRYCYVVEEGPAHFLGFAFHARRREDLDALCAAHGKPVDEIKGPGGGWRVRLQEPGGYDVDVVYGIEAEPAVGVARQVSNSGAAPLQRKGELFRVKPGRVTPLKRLAHVVLGTPDVPGSTAWFRETLGMIPSDQVWAGPDRKHIGSFMRIDAGQEYVDHHTVFLIGNPRNGLHHISFESQDIDAVLSEHHFLKKMGYEHVWGVGRHTLGSQVFDYWLDPFGYPHEHWADSDRLNADAPTIWSDAREVMITQWGEEAPERFRNGVRP